jgi:cation:H+ antiporter
VFILALIAAVLVIFVAGTMLARSGQTIADVTGIGQVWFGALVVAAVTSLPELATDTAAVLQGEPGLAVGDLFGSNMANMAILGLLAIALPAARIFARDAIELTITGSIAVILTAVAVLFVIAQLEFSIAGVFSIGSVVLAAIGAGVLILLPGYRETLAKGTLPQRRDNHEQHRWPPRAESLRFAGAAAAILIAAPILASSSDELVRRSGLGATFVGVLVLASATSLPELATSWAAVRAGALDLAVSNLFGSNAINMLVLVWLDLIYLRDPLLDTADSSAAAAGLVAILMMMIGLTAIALRSQRHRRPVEIAGLIMLGTYIAGMTIVWAVDTRAAP